MDSGKEDNEDAEAGTVTPEQNNKAASSCFYRWQGKSLILACPQAPNLHPPPMAMDPCKLWLQPAHSCAVLSATNSRTTAPSVLVSVPPPARGPVPCSPDCPEISAKAVQICRNFLYFEPEKSKLGRESLRLRYNFLGSSGGFGEERAPAALIQITSAASRWTTKSLKRCRHRYLTSTVNRLSQSTIRNCTMDVLRQSRSRRKSKKNGSVEGRVFGKKSIAPSAAIVTDHFAGES